MLRHRHLCRRCGRLVGEVAGRVAEVAVQDRCIHAGVHEEEVGVAARTNTSLQQARDALRPAGVETLIMGPEIPTGDCVRLGTMHCMKGLEFRAMAVIDVDDKTVPLLWDITPSAEDDPAPRRPPRRMLPPLRRLHPSPRAPVLGWHGTPSRFLGPVLDD